MRSSPRSAVRLSDFLLPDFFQPGSAPPFSFVQQKTGDAKYVTSQSETGYPSNPFATAPGGYQIERSSGTGEASVQGEVRPVRAAKVAHFSSRVSRRLAHNHPKPKEIEETSVEGEGHVPGSGDAA